MSIVDKLTPNPLPVEVGTGMSQPDAPDPKPDLTPTETWLMGETSNFIGRTFPKHGISLSATEIKWLAAEMADFMLNLRQEEPEEEEPAPAPVTQTPATPATPDTSATGASTGA